MGWGIIEITGAVAIALLIASIAMFWYLPPLAMMPAYRNEDNRADDLHGIDPPERCTSQSRRGDRSGQDALMRISGMTDHIVSGPSEAEIALHRAEAENARLRLTIKTLESALRAAAKLLRPYADAQ